MIGATSMTSSLSLRLVAGLFVRLWHYLYLAGHGVRTPRNTDGPTAAPRAAAQGGRRLLRRRAPGAYRHRLEAKYRSDGCRGCDGGARSGAGGTDGRDWKSTRLNHSHAN